MIKKNENSLNDKNILVRKELAEILTKEIDKMGKTQIELSKMLGITQPRVSDLIKLKIDKFSLDSLVNISDRLGYDIKFLINKKSG